MANSSVLRLRTGREPFFESFDFDQVNVYAIEAQAGDCSIKRTIETVAGIERAVYITTARGEAFLYSKRCAPCGIMFRFDDETQAIEHFKWLYETVRKYKYCFIKGTD